MRTQSFPTSDFPTSDIPGIDWWNFFGKEVNNFLNNKPEDLVNDKKAEIADKRAKEKLEFIDDALKVYEETILSGTTLPHLGEMLSAQYDGICGLDISSHFTLQGYR